MPGLDADIDFKLLSDEDLQKLLDEEKAKRAHLAPARTKIAARGKVSGGESKKVERQIKGDVIEIELD
jgi:ribosomal protein L29